MSCLLPQPDGSCFETFPVAPAVSVISFERVLSMLSQLLLQPYFRTALTLVVADAGAAIHIHARCGICISGECFTGARGESLQSTESVYCAVDFVRIRRHIAENRLLGGTVHCTCT